MNKNLVDAAYARYDRFMNKATRIKAHADAIADSNPRGAFYVQRAAFRVMDAGDIAYRHYLIRKDAARRESAKLKHDMMVNAAQRRRAFYAAKAGEYRMLASQNRMNRAGLEYLNKAARCDAAANIAFSHMIARTHMRRAALLDD